jgi:hypothetical protein
MLYESLAITINYMNSYPVLRQCRLSDLGNFNFGVSSRLPQ